MTTGTGSFRAFGRKAKMGTVLLTGYAVVMGLGNDAEYSVIRSDSPETRQSSNWIFGTGSRRSSVWDQAGAETPRHTRQARIWNTRGRTSTATFYTFPTRDYHYWESIPPGTVYFDACIQFATIERTDMCRS